jgi:hypothetical protein
VEHRGATGPPIEDMVDVSGHLSARNPRQRQTTVCQRGGWRQNKGACPRFLPSSY